MRKIKDEGGATNAEEKASRYPKRETRRNLPSEVFEDRDEGTEIFDQDIGHPKETTKVANEDLELDGDIQILGEAKTPPKEESSNQEVLVSEEQEQKRAGRPTKNSNKPQPKNKKKYPARQQQQKGKNLQQQQQQTNSKKLTKKQQNAQKEAKLSEISEEDEDHDDEEDDEQSLSSNEVISNTGLLANIIDFDNQNLSLIEQVKRYKQSLSKINKKEKIVLRKTLNKDSKTSINTLSCRAEIYTTEESWKTASMHTKDLLFMLSMLLNEHLAKRFTAWTKYRVDCTKKQNSEKLEQIVTGLGYFEIDSEYDTDNLLDTQPLQSKNEGWKFSKSIKSLNTMAEV